jgi:hypothetical protein
MTDARFFRKYVDIVNEDSSAAAQAMIDAYNALKDNPDANADQLNSLIQQYKNAFGGDITTAQASEYDAGSAEGLDNYYQDPARGEKAFERHLERYNRLLRMKRGNPEAFENSLDDKLKKFMQEFPKTDMYRKRSMF